MVVVDTDFLIASIRGNEIAKQLIRKYTPAISISAITEMELYVGATNRTKRLIVENILKTHDVIHLNKAICETALRLIKS